MKCEPQGYVDEETGEFVMPATTRARAPGRVRAAPHERNVTPPPPNVLANYVAETAARARGDARRYALRGARAAFWAVVAIVASWRFGWPFFALSVGLGAYALWEFERACVEGRIGRSA